MISAREIQNIEYQRRKVRKETYKHILEIFDKKIRKSVELGASNVFLTVPPVVIGFPLYDVEQACKYIKRQLVLLGYTVTDHGPEFYVTWGKPQPIDKPIAHVSEEDFPTFINLRKVADKIQKQNPGH
jgi:hypothetical protein